MRRLRQGRSGRGPEAEKLGGGEAGSVPAGRRVLTAHRPPAGYRHYLGVMIQFLLFFFLFHFQKLSIFHMTNSCVVSTVVDSQILLYILKVYKTGVYNGCICLESC